MGKVVSFELKKLVSRVGIYILALIMAGLLVAGALMFKPEERKVDTYNLSGDTISEMYASFTDDLQQNYESMLQTVSTNANTYIATSPAYVKYNNKQEINDLFVEFDDYCRNYSEMLATADEYAILQQGILKNLEYLYNALNEAINYAKQQTGFYILTTKSNNIALFTVLDDIEVNYASLISPKLASERYFNDYRPILCNCLQQLRYPDLDTVASKYIEGSTYYTLTSLRMEELAGSMQIIATNATDEPDLQNSPLLKSQLNSLFNKYVGCAKVFNTAYTSAICSAALGQISNKTERSNLLGYNNVSLYVEQERTVEYEYYINNNAFPEDFATGLSITHTSNNKISAYDFTYFIIAIFSVIVVIFAIYLAVNTISGEISHNTMRLTAIRPVKRGSIFFGKYLSILLISFIMLMFASITALIVGGILYGFETAHILTIINSTKVFVVHPIALIGLFILSSMLIIAVYSAIAMLISCMFKTELFGLVIALVIYLTNFTLPLFFDATSWLKFYPFANINLFAYFGSSRLTSDSIVAKLFNTVIYQGMTIWISLVYVIGITTVVLLIANAIFKRREL